MLQEPRTAGQLHLGDLPRRWRKLDFLHSYVKNEAEHREAGVIDPRRFDEARPGGHRLYPQVERYLSAAMDCHWALPRLLESHGATNTAMWCIMRAQFEAAFRALWLLAPPTSSDRVLRGIRFEWLDDRAASVHAREMLTDPLLEIDASAVAEEYARTERLRSEHDRVYRNEVAQHGRAWRDPQNLNMIMELSALDAELGGGKYRILLRHAWRTLAGLQHGNVSALLRVSDQEHSRPTEHGIHVLLSPGDAPFQSLSTTTSLLTQHALVRYLSCHRPSMRANALDLQATLDLRRQWKFA